jgi:hypothetical protein
LIGLDVLRTNAPDEAPDAKFRMPSLRLPAGVRLSFARITDNDDCSAADASGTNKVVTERFLFREADSRASQVE